VKNVLACRQRLNVSGGPDGNSSQETNYIAVASFFLRVCVLSQATKHTLTHVSMHVHQRSFEVCGCMEQVTLLHTSYQTKAACAAQCVIHRVSE